MVAVGVQEIRQRLCAVTVFGGPIAVNRRQAITQVTLGRAQFSDPAVVPVVQSIFIGIDERLCSTNAAWRDVVLRGLCFDVIGNPVVITIDVKRVDDAVLVGIDKVARGKDELRIIERYTADLINRSVVAVDSLALVVIQINAQGVGRVGLNFVVKFGA